MIVDSGENVDDLEDLEKVLQAIDKELFDKYSKLVDDLTKKVYNNINEALAASYGIYTNHGKEHFDKVIEQAGYLLSVEKILQVVYKEKDIKKLDCADKTTFFFLNSMELFVLLCSIRVHDIALLIDRENHSSNVVYTISILNIDVDRSIKHIISEISGAHTGETKDNSKDKISELKKLESIKSQKIRPQMLAAIVRFADELEEGYHRTSQSKLTTGKVEPKNIVFHKYSLSITDLSINHDDNKVILTFEIDSAENEVYEKPNGKKVTLLEEIYDRLQKLEQERKYFHRFLCNSMSIEGIESKIHFRDKNANLWDTISTKTGETYPNIDEHGLSELQKRINKDKK